MLTLSPSNLVRLETIPRPSTVNPRWARCLLAVAAIALLSLVTVPSLAEPVLSPAQREKLKVCKIPVAVPSYVPVGYTLVSTVADAEGYNLTYLRSGKADTEANRFTVYGIRREDFTRQFTAKPKESWPVRHPSFGEVKLIFLEGKMRGGPLTLKPMLSHGVAHYNLEGVLPGPEAVKVVESLQTIR